jgi:hypothetical protein
MTTLNDIGYRRVNAEGSTRGSQEWPLDVFVNVPSGH